MLLMGGARKGQAVYIFKSQRENVIMKNLLLSLLALIVVVPAWAGDAAPVSWAGVVIELKGPTESVSALVAKLKKAPAYKAAACEAVNESKFDCAKADSGLMAFLGKNAPASIQWSISSSAAEGKCLPGCAIMQCPPPGGPIRCCNLTTKMPC